MLTTSSLAEAAAPPDAVGAAVLQSGYARHDYRVAMRDGVQLYTVVYTPKDTSKTYPILLVRTAYGTDAWVMNGMSHSIGPTQAFDRDGYIFVYQDLRGLNKSAGVYDRGGVYRPNKGPKDVDESSDAYDTIDWLIHHVPHNSGKVGIWGISAEGRTTILSLLDRHPALVAASPQAAPGDYFIGDDAYHNGAFRPAYNFGFILHNDRVDREKAGQVDATAYKADPWDYDFFLKAGGLDALDAKYLHGAAPVWTDSVRHDTYDAFWKALNTPQYLKSVDIPVLNVGGWFDAEDFWGTLANYQALEAGHPGAKNSLILGPWNHGGWYYLPGDGYGDIRFGQKTAVFFREEILRPFFRKYLKGEGDFPMPKVLAFNTGANRWRAFPQWPPAGTTPLPLYLGDHASVTLDPPRTRAEDASDGYVSDPAKPVPFTTEIRKGMGGRWIVEDQRLASTRPDVLSYSTGALDHDVAIAGPIDVDLWVSTTGTDSDWIVKLIDVYPDDAPDNPEEADKIPDIAQPVRMGGYQMMLGGEILRGKFRNSLSDPQPMTPGKVTEIRFALDAKLHTFRAGHRIMVQVQSSWFPLYDRNPQTFMHIPAAKPEDFRPAEERIYRSAAHPSHLTLPVIAASALEAATYSPAP